MKNIRKPTVIVSWWLSIIEAVLVRYVKINEEWIRRVREAASRGPVVFVMRNRSMIDLLCLRGLCKRHDLPTLGFVSGISPFLFLPWWRWLLALFRRRLPDRQRRRLVDTFQTGGSALVFLRRPAYRGALGSRPVKIDGIRLAVEAQDEVGGPVLALPTVFLWGEGAMHRLSRTFDFMLGTNEYPRLLRSLWLLVRRRSVHGAWVEDPLDLAAIREERKVDNEALPGVIRAGVGRGVEKIRRLRLGGLTKPSSRVKEEVVRSDRLMDELRTIAQDEGIPEQEIVPRTRDIINKLATDFKPRVITFFAALMAFVWRKIFNGLDVRPQDFENLRAAVAKGPLLILPDHKSHIDYLAISQVMQDANIMLPHIAAGDNLSFWPLGPLFRSSGAFFIRRKFINNRFYTAVVNAYVRRLIYEGYAIEVFIEGGRSRTGKLLRPKLGILEMTLRAMVSTPSRDPGIMPTFIGYDHVIEERSYVRESEGRKKKSESVGGLMTTPRVLFNRYGRLYVRTGEFFTIQQIIDEMGYSREDLSQGQVRRAVSLKAAMRTLEEINRIAVATPAAILATALLTQPDASITRSRLRKLSVQLVEFLRKQGVSLSDKVEKWNGEMEGHRDSLNKAISIFVKDGRLKIVEKGDDPVYEIKQDQRLPMDFYKNNIIHFFVPSALIAASCLGAGDQGISVNEARENFALACRIYRWEFFMPEFSASREDVFNAEVDVLVDNGIRALETSDLISRAGDRLHVRDREETQLLSNILLNFHEIYLSALRTLRSRVIGDVTGDLSRLARADFERTIGDGEFTKPEGKTRINLQNAFQSFKDLKINRPTADQHPFDKGELGDRLIKLLENTIGEKQS